MGWLASVRVRFSIRLGVVAQAERRASFSELAPEVALRVFPENSRAFHHCLMLSATSRMGPCAYGSSLPGPGHSWQLPARSLAALEQPVPPPVIQRFRDAVLAAHIADIRSRGPATTISSFWSGVHVRYFRVSLINPSSGIRATLAQAGSRLWVPKTRPGLLSRHFARRDRIRSGVYNSQPNTATSTPTRPLPHTTSRRVLQPPRRRSRTGFRHAQSRCV